MLHLARKCWSATTQPGPSGVQHTRSIVDEWAANQLARSACATTVLWPRAAANDERALARAPARFVPSAAGNVSHSRSDHLLLQIKCLTRKRSSAELAPLIRYTFQEAWQAMPITSCCGARCACTGGRTIRDGGANGVTLSTSRRLLWAWPSARRADVSDAVPKGHIHSRRLLGRAGLICRRSPLLPTCYGEAGPMPRWRMRTWFQSVRTKLRQAHWDITAVLHACV